MGRNERDVFWICVVMSMALALVAVALALPRGAGAPEFDYQGVYVAIFAALVTLLIGWQIFSVLGISRQMDDARKAVRDSARKIEEIEKELENRTVKLKDMNYGMYFVNNAVSCFLQARFGSDKIDYSQFATSYLLVMRGFRHLLKGGYPIDEAGRIFNLGVGLMEIVMEKFETGLQGHREILKTAFNAEKHIQADNWFYEVATVKETLVAEMWSRIERLHNRRIAFRHDCGL